MVNLLSGDTEWRYSECPIFYRTSESNKRSRMQFGSTLVVFISAVSLLDDTDVLYLRLSVPLLSVFKPW